MRTAWIGSYRALGLWGICFLSCVLSRAQLARGEKYIGQNGDASISGYVTFEDRAVPSIVATAFRVEVRDGFQKAVEACERPLDKNGGFACPGLISGRYLVALQGTTAVEFYPGVSALSQASVINLNSGENRSIEFAFPTYVSGSVDGTLRPAPRRAAFRLSCIDPDRPGLEIRLKIQPQWLQDQEDWQFHDLPYGDYQLYTEWVGAAIDMRSTIVLNVYSPSLGGVPITDQTHQSITGRIVGDRAGQSPLSVDFIPDDSAKGIIHVHLGSDGYFRLSRVAEGTYVVQMGTKDMTVAFVSQNGSRQEANRIRFGDEDSSLEIGVAAADGVLKGQVVDDDGIGVTAEVLLIDQTTGELHLVSSDDAGDFTAEGLPRHAYTACAWESAKQLPYKEPRVLTYLANSGVLVDLSDPLTAQRLHLKALHLSPYS